MYSWVSQMVSLLQVFQQKLCFHVSSLPYVLHSLWIHNLIKNGKDYTLCSCLLQFQSASCCFLSLRSRYSLQCLDLKHFLPASSLNIRDQVLHVNKVMGISTVMCVFYLLLVILDRRKDVKFEDKRFWSE